MRIRDIELHKDGVSQWQVYGTYEELDMGVLGKLSDP